MERNEACVVFDVFEGFEMDVDMEMNLDKIMEMDMHMPVPVPKPMPKNNNHLDMDVDMPLDMDIDLESFMSYDHNNNNTLNGIIANDNVIASNNNAIASNNNVMASNNNNVGSLPVVDVGTIVDVSHVVDVGHVVNVGSVVGAVSGPVGGDLAAAARFDILKKKRMPRFRRGALGTSAVRPFRPYNTLGAPLNGSHGRLAFLFSKKLQKSDVGVLKRIVLPKKPTETHLPGLIVKEGIVLEMDDMDGMNVWCFKFRFWPNNNSRMYVLEGTGDFAEEHELQVGDYIMVYRDTVQMNYVIHAVKAFEVEEYAKKEASSNLITVNLPPPPPPSPNPGFMNQDNTWGGLDVELINPANYPKNVPSIEEHLTPGFIYDTSYIDDTFGSLDIFGLMSSNPATQPVYLVDSLTYDDLYLLSCWSQCC
ncbi:B3 domain-containing transcription factor FUS3-like [Bidens hawaiensis]|uniref:B3 domain-containing transcription factor FUS3-like n=1 Tax=Bidens hawaiensis TaxID=980011 RepID=UPI00404B65A5